MNLIRPLIKSSLLHKQSYHIRYSREYLKSLDIDQTAVEQNKTQIQKKLKKQFIFNKKTNDRNVNNHLKVRINHPLFNVSYYPQNHAQTVSIMQPDVTKQRKLISATRKYIISSIKKCREALYPIKRLYVIDAINTLMGSQKKVGKLMIRTFWNLLDHAKQRGFDPMRLWVHGCLIGKTRRYFGVRYHAKGRGAKQKRDFIQVKVVLYEKDQNQFLQQLAEGKCPSGLANAVRRMILQRPDSNYETLTKYAYITTAKGRQQASQMLKRRIDAQMIKNQKQGVFVPKKQIRKDLLKQMAEKVRQHLKSLNPQTDEAILLKREQLYKKNMGISN